MPKHIPLPHPLRALAAERQSIGHPGPELLVAYHEQGLEPEEREVLQDHLAVCPECAHAVLDMATFPEVEPMGDDPVASLSLGEELAQVQRRIGIDPTADRAPSMLSKAGGHRSRSVRWLELRSLPLAAIFAFLAVGLGAFVGFQGWKLGQLERQIESMQAELSQGESSGHSFEIVSLKPLGTDGVRGEIPALPAASGEGGGPIPLILNFYAREEVGYEAHLLDAEGHLLRVWKDLRPTSKKNLTLLLPPPLQRPGTFGLVIYRPGADRDSPEASFRYQILAPTSSD